MIKFEDKNDDYVYIYSDDPEEIQYLIGKTKVVFTQEHNGFPAILVRKEKLNKKSNAAV